MHSLKSVAVLTFSLLSSSLYADALITKTSSSGFSVEPTSETCNVYDNYVEVIKTGYFYGYPYDSIAYYSHNKGEDIRFALNMLSREIVLETPNYLCDAPVTEISATLDKQEYVLFDSGACGSDRKKRIGNGANMLVSIVDRYCPTTHDLEAPAN
ncbi:hypothetical protein [Pleionea sediminis]|uniref:hypothetical protein n=1 Tax=Pleionea sediminis TaxID=2569479 RepID=UPI001186F85B|nr:hypothetical protein [Pleionea sediminis]